jgi:ATP-dependent RNA helicase DeaD
VQVTFGELFFKKTKRKLLIMAKTFRDLNLSESLLACLDKKGYVNPSPIQALVIPELLKDENVDLIGQAQTGTGKTAAFSIPIIETITHQDHIQAIILTPTRELAIQVCEEIYSFSNNKKLKVNVAYGGSSIEQQIKSIKKACDILVGTPGRILDLIARKVVKLDSIKYFVLDEADEMLNMGFIDDIELILKGANKNRKTLFFSATMPSSILKIAKKYMKEYKILKVEAVSLSQDLTEQIYFEIKDSDKFEALCRVLDCEQDFYGIIFGRTKTEVDNINQHLKSRGYLSDTLHGDIKQVQRTKTLKQFKEKHTNILVATDVAARGIDVNNLTHVINYCIPQDPESYVHRIGRTGRAGRKGIAITFVTPSELSYLLAIKKATNGKIIKQSVPKPLDIVDSKIKFLDTCLSKIIEEKDHECYLDLAQLIINKHSGVEAALAALLRYQYKDELLVDSYKNIDRVNIGDNVKLFLAIGRRDNINVKGILDLLYSKCKIPSRNVRDIRILPEFSFITVPLQDAEKIISSLNVGGKRIANLAKR